jgi:hypothetical protein
MRREHATRALRLSLALVLLGGSTATRVVSADDVARVRKDGARQLVDDYIRLYRRETLERWKDLFLPTFTATYTNDDGSVSTRTLDDFYERQRSGFAAGEMTETLSNLSIQEKGRLASAAADFDFTSRGAARRGKLMLLMIEDRGQLKIAALIFTYHSE